MKTAMWAGAAIAMVLGGAAQARQLDLTKGEDALAASRKVQCSTRDGVAVVYAWTGRVYSRVPGEPDRHLFDVQGMNIRQCGTVNDPKRGFGYRMVSRELMFYLDPKTGEVMKSWTNPWTGRTVEVIPVVNDPVNMRPAFATSLEGKPFDLGARIEHGRVFLNTEVPLFYRNPLGGDYQDYVGNQYHAMEIFDTTLDASDLLDASRSEARPVIAWVRISEWLPWMQMGGRPGNLIFNATGQTVAGIEGLSPLLRREIETEYPAWKSPPPLDDARPNETSWTYFKKRIDAQRAAAPPPAAR